MVFFTTVNSSCFMSTIDNKFENIDLTETRLLLEAKLASLECDTKSFSEEEIFKLSVEKKNLTKAIEQIKELEKSKGVKEYWQKVKTKATKGAIIAVAAGVVAIIIGGIITYFTVKGYSKMKADLTDAKAMENKMQTQLTNDRTAFNEKISQFEENKKAEIDNINQKSNSIEYVIEHFETEFVDTLNNDNATKEDKKSAGKMLKLFKQMKRVMKPQENKENSKVETKQTKEGGKKITILEKVKNILKKTNPNKKTDVTELEATEH